jgi:rod shape determining protein RodA
MLIRYRHQTVWHTIGALNWGIIGLITLVACIGFVMLFSAGDGQGQPWAYKQMARFVLGMGLMFMVAVIELRWWLARAYWFYAVGVILLVIVETMGMIGMGAQRWIDLYVFQLQPSEIMKFALVLALARYFHGLSLKQVRRWYHLIPPLLLIGVPMLLVMRQPDLGTAMMMLITGATLFFLAGVQIWKFMLVAGIGAGAVPIFWSLLRDYQKNRILTFLDPERDPFGAGYHITQSKIALGSGHIWGKGYLHGSQSHLNFLPEKQTDFIFTMFCEEFGIVGAGILMVLYLCLIFYGVRTSLRCRSHFGRLSGMGIIGTFFFYAFINMAMVMGLVPVVGVPLPLISYGGTAMLTILIGFGFLLAIEIQNASSRSKLD